MDSKTMHRGDQIYAQVTAPVTLQDRVVIPPGTFVQGKIEKLKRNGSRGEFSMQSLSLAFPDGSVADVPGPTQIESGEETALRNPSSGAKAGAIIAPLAGGGLGALIGSTAHTTQSTTLGGTTLTSSSPKGIAIGSMVGLAAGGAVSLALLFNSRDFYVEVGSPMEMTLAQPLVLARVPTQGPPQAQVQPTMPIARRPLPPVPADHGICYTPGTPGTPPTIIPGTPPIGDSPGTPDIVIPGTPPTPGTPYPCP